MILSEEPSLTLVVTWRGFRVESNPTLCRLLNRDVGTFVVLNFKSKLCLSCACIDLLLEVYFHTLAS
jgi:hypothetical protein